MAIMPAWQQATRATTLMMTTTPLQQGQQCQLKDGNNAITTRATTPSRIKGDNTIIKRATMPAWQCQGCLRINNGNNTIVMRATIAIATTAKRPVHQWQWCHHNKNNNSSLPTSYEGDDASFTTTETPAYQQWQWCLHGKSNNCHWDNGKDVCALTATTPSQQGNNASLMTSDKGNDACMRTHTNKHIICSYLHAPLQTYHMFELISQLTNLANLCCGQGHNK
jgi:hypothetical protein